MVLPTNTNWKQLPVTIKVKEMRVTHVTHNHGIKVLGNNGVERKFEDITQFLDDSSRALIRFVARGDKPYTNAGKEMVFRYFGNGNGG